MKLRPVALASASLEADLARLLLPHGPEIRARFHAARGVLRGVFPTAAEAVRAGWHLTGFSAPRYFAFVTAYRGAVRIGLDHASDLLDPAGLLTGAGARLRYVEVADEGVLAHEALVPLLLAAHRAAHAVPGTR